MTATREPEVRPRPVGRGRRRRLLVLTAALGALALVRGVALEPMTVTSGSMSPTLEPGQAVLVDKLGTRLLGVHRDDLVVFSSPADGEDALKRVVAVGGQQVAIRDAVLYVDGAAVHEPQVDLSRVDGLYFGPVAVPAGAVFVLGDARDVSVDSRAYGAVPLDAVRGRVVAELW